MKNVFSYPYETIFTGKEIKDYLTEYKSKGNSLYRLSQYLSCKDDVLYKMVEIPGTGSGEKYIGFIKLENVE